MIKRHAKINCSPALGILVDAWKELIDRRWSPNEVMIYWDDEAITYWNEDKVIGVVSFTKAAHLDELFVKIGYVRPIYRRTGIYREMWKELVSIAREKGCSSIIGGRHVENSVKRVVDTRMNRVDEGVYTRFLVS